MIMITRRCVNGADVKLAYHSLTDYDQIYC